MRIQLFNARGQVVAENDDWVAADVSATADRVGAFRLTAGSRDAAFVASLEPGAYTAQVTSASGSGVVLIEGHRRGPRRGLRNSQPVNGPLAPAR